VSRRDAWSRLAVLSRCGARRGRGAPDRCAGRRRWGGLPRCRALGRVASAAAGLGLAGVWGVAAAHAQSATGRVAVLAEPSGTAVALAVLLNAGSGWEAENEAGLSHLAARSVAEEVAARLEALDATVAVHCGGAAIGFTLLAPPETWRPAATLLLDALFRSSPSDGAVARARAALEATLRMDDASPAAHARNALREAHYGVHSRWARPPCGQAEDVASYGTGEVRRMLRTRFVPSRAVAAVVGPVVPREALDLLGRELGDVSLPVLLPRPQPRPASRRVWLTQPTVTTWLGWAYPFPPDADREAVELLAFRIEQAAGPSPAHPEVYDISVAVERHGAGGALLISLVAAPEHAPRWAARIEDLVRRLGVARLPDNAFRDLTRRYLGRRLLELATPEARALDAARQLFFDHSHRPPEEAVRDLTPERLRLAAASLGSPAHAVLGPE
jgi:predicted Zn-dependent peptidase